MRALTPILCGIIIAGCSTEGGPPPIPSVPTNVGAADHDYHTLYNFQGWFGSGDGAFPAASLTYLHGKLYGTTTSGSVDTFPGYGTIFEMSTAGQERVIYSFKGGTDGGDPWAGLTVVNGALYGTTVGVNNSTRYYYGTVFKVSTSGKERVLYEFTGGADGGNPFGGLVDLKGTLYGTTYDGGTNGAGTVFAVDTSGNERVIYSFKGYADGANPEAGVIALRGKLYGTTYAGGPTGNGVVFEVSTSGKERVLYAFRGGKDGAVPFATLIALNGTLFGTTKLGGGRGIGKGTVFAVDTSGNEHVVYRFTGRSGEYPTASLIVVNGIFYGTTDGVGLNDGNVFSVTTSGEEHVLYRFKPEPDSPANPLAALLDVNGTLYGTAFVGGTANSGAVFSLKP